MKTNFNFQIKNSSDPLYRQVAEYLRSQIVSGKLAPGERLPPEQELAEHLSVSRLTLRKGLGILIAQNLITQIPHHGTFVSEQQKRHLRIGIVWKPNNSGIESSYVSSLLLAICQAASLYPNTEIVFLNRWEKSPAQRVAYISNSRCDGLILPTGSGNFDPVLDDAKFDSIPICTINNQSQNFSGMRYNVALEPDAIKTAVRYLTDRGHSKIAYISKEENNSTLKNRNRSFLESAPKEAIPLISDARIPWFEYARRTAIKLCQSPAPPTAIVTPGAHFSSGVWHGLMECGKKIPADISVLGFDNVADSFPRLSTIDQPIAEMAAQAMSLVHDSALGKVFRNHIYYFQPIISDRGSIRKI